LGAFNFSHRYLVPEGAAFSVTTSKVDPEIAIVAGPQLVCPIDNARFILNAANARWGSLLDALYGTDVIDEEDGATKGSSYNPIRGAKVHATLASTSPHRFFCRTIISLLAILPYLKSSSIISSLKSSCDPTFRTGRYPQRSFPAIGNRPRLALSTKPRHAPPSPALAPRHCRSPERNPHGARALRPRRAGVPDGA
jgi:malate synthase